MRPIFTIHAGEFLAGDFIQRSFRRVQLWIPAKDTGVDLLVTDAASSESVSLQVKFSRDFTATHLTPALQRGVRAAGWWSLNRDKLESSRADLWVFVLVGFGKSATDFVVIPPGDLLRRLDAVHPAAKTIQSYLWVTNDERCWEARRLRQADQTLVASGQFSDIDRDFSAYLNSWGAIEHLNTV